MANPEMTGGAVRTAQDYVDTLGLKPHVEGGWFKEVYRNGYAPDLSGYQPPLSGPRSLATTIYFLLKSGQVSRFHRLKCDEIWFYHDGCPMVIHQILSDGSYSRALLGLNCANGERPQVLVGAGTIFGSEPLSENSYSLVSCMVTPGFDFQDFEMFSQDELSRLYPGHAGVIARLCGGVVSCSINCAKL